jgi:lactate racemase
VELSLPYGRSSLSGAVADDAVTIAPRQAGHAALTVDEVRERMADLGPLLARTTKIALIVNDQTRKAGMRTLLDAIAPLLPRGVDLVVAYGLHARQSDETTRAIYGDAVLSRVHVTHHDARDAASLVKITDDLSIQKRVADADLRVLVGGIGFHYYAGFSGGRKAILPGVADAASIERNHLRVLDPSGPNGRAAGCGPARLDGNPVSEEMFAAARLVDARHGQTYLANALIGNGGVVDLACGLDAEASFRAGCARYVESNAVPVPELDAVVASAGGWPYDASLYQAHKAYDNAYRTGAKTVIFIARCDEGLGHPRFAHWLQQPTREAHYDALLKGYEIVGQTSLAVRDKAALTRTIAVTELDDATCERLGWTRAASLTEALRMADAKRWGVMPAAAQVLPTHDPRLTTHD